jgi:hypothetical protein
MIPIGIVGLFLEVIVKIIVEIVEVTLLVLKRIVERAVIVAVIVVITRTGTRNDRGGGPPHQEISFTPTGVSTGKKCCGAKHVRFS